MSRPLEHIGRSIWGARYSPENLFAMWTAYFDEAMESGFLFVCGWVASVLEWERFEGDWKIFLASYNMPYFHMKEFAHSKGPFEKWKNAPNTRNRFMSDAWDVIKSHVRNGLVSCMHDSGFAHVNKIYRLDSYFAGPYALLGRACMEWAKEHANASHEEVECIFDDGAPGKGGLLRAANLPPMLNSPIFRPSRDIQDSKGGKRYGVVQIQAADYSAYEVRKFLVERAIKASGRPPRISLTVMGQRQPETLFMTEAKLTELCEKIGIERRKSNG